MEYIKLCDIASINAGGTPSRDNNSYWNGQIPWLKISDIKGKYTDSCTEYITEEGLNNSSAKYFKKNTILYTIFATIGETSILKFDATTNQAIAGIKLINDNFLVDYLYYYLKSLKKRVKHDSKGVAQNNINLTYLKKLNVPNVNINIQKQIVKDLTNIEELILRSNKMQENLDNIVKSQFIEMFGNRLINLNKKMSSIATPIIGLTYKPANVTKDGKIVLRSGNIQNNELQLEEDIVRVSNIKIPEQKLIRDKDILMCSRNGSARLVGKSCLIRHPEEKMSFGAFMTVVRTKYPYFLQAFFASDYFKSQLTGVGTASVNQITSGMLNNYDAIEPTEAEEKEFESYVKLIDKSKYFGGAEYGIC